MKKKSGISFSSKGLEDRRKIRHILIKVIKYLIKEYKENGWELETYQLLSSFLQHTSLYPNPKTKFTSADIDGIIYFVKLADKEIKKELKN